MSNSKEQIEARARELQANGPDEFPWGYYLFLAEEEISSDCDSDSLPLEERIRDGF